jgi:hypothetical protein
MSQARGKRQPEPAKGKRKVSKELFGPGAVGAWTEEELANLPQWEAPPELATRDQEDAEALRKGVAIEGRRKRVGTRRLGNARPYDGSEERPPGEGRPQDQATGKPAKRSAAAKRRENTGKRQR